MPGLKQMCFFFREVQEKLQSDDVKRGGTMPEFVNPFSGKIPERQLTSEELIRAIRLDLAAEHEAVHAYMAHADATDNPVAKAVLIDIANEERVHAGEFARLLALLTGDEDEFLTKGALEVNAISAKIAQSVQVTADQDIPTVGSLKSG
jgi:rubrerythrin